MIGITCGSGYFNNRSMPELNLLADFAQLLFPFAFVGQRIGVGAPKFFHHLALWHEGTFRFRIFVGVSRREVDLLFFRPYCFAYGCGESG